MIGTQWEREAETQAEGEAGSMHREPDVGFDPGYPGLHPGPKAGAKPLRHPGIPLFSFVILFGSFHIFVSVFFFKDFIYVFMWDTERQRYRQRENEAPCGEHDVGLDPPGPRDHDLSQSRCSTTEAPRCLSDLIPLLVMGLFTFSISSYFSFAHLHISGDLSISSRSPSLLAYNLS